MPRGFTLLELLITIGIGALLAVLSATLSFSYLRVQRLEACAEIVVSQLLEAQTESYTLLGGTAHGVEILSDSTVRFSGSAYATRTTSGDQVVTFPGTVSVSGTSEVDFPLGSLSPSTAGSVTLTDGSQTVTITISTYGILETTRGAVQP